MFKRIAVSVFMFWAMLHAAEGMWLMTQIKDLDLANKGFAVPASGIYHPDETSIHQAIVWLGGCSASFVSSRGLLLTNHHCAYGALQRASAQEGVDYLKHGFLAASTAEEIPAPDLYAYVLTGIEDVSRDVIRAARSASDVTERERLMKRKCREIEESTEENREDIHCRVVKLFEGREYRKYVYKKYLDVRFVYAPPESIGRYGGDIDNWMWPRHTGDFTFLRVYQAPDGTIAPYSEENVPLENEAWLQISNEGFSEGDPAFIIGFPGTTTRYRTAADVEYTLNKDYLPRIAMFQDLLQRMQETIRIDSTAAIRLASLDFGINNTMKKYQGNVDGMIGTDFIPMKKEEEKALQTYVKSNNRIYKRYGDILDGIRHLYAEREAFHANDQALDHFGYYSGTLYYLADYAYQVAREREKPVADRDPEFSEKRLREFVDRLPYRYLSYHELYDMKALVYAFEKAAAAPEGFYFFQLPDDPEVWVKDAYRNTRLKDPEFARRLFSMRASQIENINDPIIQLAVSLYAPKFEKKERLRNWDARMNDLRFRYMELLEAYRNSPLYPDATGTMRFTWGTIEGYTPRDAVWYKPISTLSGGVAKHTGEKLFDMPEKLIELSRKKDYGTWADPVLKDVPACFLLTADITGGNSGSAVMDRNGKLIGLAFDGNYEAMTSDWRYQEDIQRTIAVDIRYVLFITDKFAGAQRIIDEIGK